MKISLNGSWKFRDASENKWLDATVPGCNYLDLMNAGVLADPFVGMNEKDSYYVAQKDWEYTRTVEVSAEDLDHQEVYLKCDMLDTLCDVFVNDTKIAYAENCHIRYAFEIKKYLKAGENTFRFYFHSPVNYVKDIAKSDPYLPMLMVRMVFALSVSLNVISGGTGVLYFLPAVSQATSTSRLLIQLR